MPDLPIRLILADDHPIVLHGLQQFLERSGEFEVVSSCQDGQQALAMVRLGTADVLVLDLRMPGLSGLDVLRAMAAERLPCRVVLLTAALRDAEAAEVMQLGAKGLVLKESPPEALVECVRRVHRGEEWIDRAAIPLAFDRMVRPESNIRPRTPSGGLPRVESIGRAPSGALTAREIEIVRLVAQGLRNRDIGQRLFISEGTVKIHLHNAYEKLGVTGRLELLLYAQEKGLLP